MRSDPQCGQLNFVGIQTTHSEQIVYWLWSPIAASKRLSISDRIRSNVSRAALSQFRVRDGIPAPRGKPKGFALFATPDLAREEIHDIGGARLVFGSGQAVELVGKFLGYLDDAWHGSVQAPRLGYPRLCLN